ncbi:MAG: V-type ATP synthase subunit E [Halohasta sp.]
MSLEQVRDDIEKEARARADEIRAEAEERAEEIISAAEADAEEIKATRSAEVDDEIDQRREQALSGAKLEAKQARLEARRDVLEDVREEIEDALVDLDDETREELTESLIENAAAEFDDDDRVVVHGRADDEDLLKDLLASYDGFSVGEPVDCLGGVIVESETSRVRVNNTFDSVLESVWDDQLKDISALLFEQ